MKQDYTKFVCDNCKKEILKNKGEGFPYEDKWCYIYNFTGKILRYHAPPLDTDIGRFENKDKHFCSEKCLMEWIKNGLKEAKKVIPIKIDTDLFRNISKEAKKKWIQKT